MGDPIARNEKLTTNDKMIKGVMEKLLEKYKLKDIYRLLNLPRIDFTFEYGNKLGSRLNRFYRNNFNYKTYKNPKITNVKAQTIK